jgi:uncharacterized protein (DUF885 family)
VDLNHERWASRRIALAFEGSNPSPISGIGFAGGKATKSILCVLQSLEIPKTKYAQACCRRDVAAPPTNDEFWRAILARLCAFNPMTSTSRQFEGILDRYFETLLKDVPVTAAISGLPAGEGKLGRLNPPFQEKRERSRKSTLRSLESISPRELSNEQQLDRLALRSSLLKECEDYARGRHTLEPNAPEQIFGILLHELQRGHDQPSRAAKNIRALLKQTPLFLSEAATLIKNPERVWLRVMEQTVAGSAELLAGAASFLEKTPAPSDVELLQSAKVAFNSYRDHVAKKSCAPAGSFALGAPAVQRRVHDELGLDYTLGQVEALALGEVDRVGGLLRQACARYGKNKRPGEILDRLRSEWQPRGSLLELYKAETDRVASGFRKAQAVTFPKHDELQLLPVPDFLRNLIPTAAYSQPGAFEKRQRGIFWVNDLSVTKESAAEKLAEQRQHFGIPLTCAHEGYPGHHLQFVTANQHPRKWRRLFAHAIFYEGWTLWCEQMMVDLKVNRSPWLQLQQLHDALWRCHRILVDLRLQTSRYSYEQAVKHMQTNLSFTRGRAEADVNWYTASPCVPMSYWLGRLENERLRRRLIEGRGWGLKKFNDWLLSFGTIPQAWIEKYGLD